MFRWIRDIAKPPSASCRAFDGELRVRRRLLSCVVTVVVCSPDEEEDAMALTSSEGATETREPVVDVQGGGDLLSAQSDGP